MGDWQRKVWGRTRCVVTSAFYSRHELEIRAGGYCSLHYHRHRCNRFNIEFGHTEIIEFIGPYVKRTHLRSGDQYDVPSLVPHLFVAWEGTSLTEEYYSDRGGVVRDDDIVRLVQGSLSDDLPGLVQNLLGGIELPELPPTISWPA
jgi:hypothetical protein